MSYRNKNLDNPGGWKSVGLSPCFLDGSAMITFTEQKNS